MSNHVQHDDPLLPYVVAFCFAVVAVILALDALIGG